MKTITKDNYTLQYYRYIDDMGFEQDIFELIYTEPSGHRILLPFFGDIKVNTKKRSDPINTIGYEYTDEDLERMLDEQIQKFKSYPQH